MSARPTPWSLLLIAPPRPALAGVATWTRRRAVAVAVALRAFALTVLEFTVRGFAAMGVATVGVISAELAHELATMTYVPPAGPAKGLSWPQERAWVGGCPR